jgi:hypothetical protein
MATRPYPFGMSARPSTGNDPRPATSAATGIRVGEHVRDIGIGLTDMAVEAIGS